MHNAFRSVGLAFGLLLAAGFLPSTTNAQSDAELRSISGRVIELHRAGKLAEAIPLAKRYAEGIKARLGANSAEYATALHNLAYLLVTANQAKDAEPLYRRALGIYEKTLGPDNPKIAVTLNGLGHVSRIANRLQEAEGHHRRALKIQEKNFGSDHVTLAVTLDSLASLLQSTDRLAEAETYYRRALAIKERSFGADHLAVSETLTSLASILAATSRPAEAEGFYRRALSIQEARLGSDHPKVSSTLSSLAGLLGNLNRFAEAELLHRRALAINEKTFGPDDARTDTINALIGFALMLQGAGRIAEAETIYRRALILQEKKHGPDHPEVASALGFLASLFSSTNRHREAEAPLRRALAIRENTVTRDPAAVVRALESLAEVLQETNRPAEAGEFYKRALEIAETSFGSDHWMVGSTLIDFAHFLHATGNLSEAEPIIHRLLKMPDRNYGPNHRFQATNLGRFAQLLFLTNRIGEAEAFHRRALALHEKNSGPVHPYVAQTLSDLAQLLVLTSSRFGEAEQLLRRALRIQETSLGSSDLVVANTLATLADVLQATNRLGEAEVLERRVLAIRESTLGPDHMLVAVSLNGVAKTLNETNRLSEAEPLLRRALAIQEQGDTYQWTVVVTLNNLAYLLMKSGRLAEAEELFRRALSTGERALGAEHWMIADLPNNLAMALQEAKRFDEAEPLYRRALAISEGSLGVNHPNVGRYAYNLARLLHATGRLAEAERLYRRSLAIFETSLTAQHPYVAVPLTGLAVLFAERGDWQTALALHARAKPILAGRRGVEANERSDLTKARVIEGAKAFRAHARAAYRVGAEDATVREEGFEAAQSALQTSAADALTQVSARFAKGSGPLAVVVRERQDLILRRRFEDKRLIEAVGKAEAKATAAIRTTILDIDKRLDVIDRRLAKEFPSYSELSDPKPLSIDAVQTLLMPNEVLLVFLDVPRLDRLPGETLAWAITKTAARWISIPLGTEALAERVAKLRCGLDREGRWTWSEASQRWDAKGPECRTLKPEGLAAREPLPFELGVAHELYQALLAPFVDLISGKSLMIVPSGPLTSLPFHVLVTEAPREVALRNVSWLALKQSVAVLPSVGSLQALRALPPSNAKEPYIAFGNPLLDGDGSAIEVNLADQARSKQKCPQNLKNLLQHASVAFKSVPWLSAILRGGSVDLSVLRRQAPLPETADELCGVAKALGALGREADTVWLGARATEANLKALSKEGKLARYRVLHFATHGLLAGESEAILKSKAEPALMLTPPKDGATLAELEEDDGLLTASEVAHLNLDADWVVLSACNTAAGNKGDAEVFSGLARAFFYAKARALLVSHWYVSSAAAVKLTTVALEELSRTPAIGRAEALRRSMAALLTKGRPEEAHPSNWAPFVLVGESGAARFGSQH